MENQTSARPIEVETKLSGRTQVLALDYKIAALLCYAPIPFVCLIAPIVWLATEPKNNKQLRFHAVQALGIFVAALIFGVVNSVLTSVLVGILGVGILWLVGPAQGLISLAFLGLMIYAMYQIWNDKPFKLPVLGDIAEKNA